MQEPKKKKILRQIKNIAKKLRFWLKTKSQSQSQPTVLMRPNQKNKNKNTFLIYKETKTKIRRLNYIIMLLKVIYTPDDNIVKELI